jgi:hypothetical protein
MIFLRKVGLSLSAPNSFGHDTDSIYSPQARAMTQIFLILVLMHSKSILLDLLSLLFLSNELKSTSTLLVPRNFEQTIFSTYWPKQASYTSPEIAASCKPLGSHPQAT